MAYFRGREEPEAQPHLSIKGWSREESRTKDPTWVRAEGFSLWASPGHLIYPFHVSAIEIRQCIKQTDYSETLLENLERLQYSKDHGDSWTLRGLWLATDFSSTYLPMANFALATLASRLCSMDHDNAIQAKRKTHFDDQVVNQKIKVSRARHVRPPSSCPSNASLLLPFPSYYDDIICDWSSWPWSSRQSFDTDRAAWYSILHILNCMTKPLYDSFSVTKGLCW